VPNDDIQRLQDDLSTMRQAMRLDKPYAAADFGALLLFGFGGLATIALLTFTTWNPRLCFLVPLVPGLIAYARRYSATRRVQAARPVLWQEYKLSAIAALVAIPASAGWITWSQRFGATREAAGSTIVFCIGVVMLGIGALDSKRRIYLVGGAGMIAFGMAVLCLGPRQMAVAGAAMIAVVCLAGAAFTRWKTRLEWNESGESESAI